MTRLKVSKAIAWDEAWAGSYGLDRSKEIKYVQCRDGTYVKLCGRSGVGTDGPVVHINDQTEELLGKEIAMVGLMEINTVC